MSETETLRGLWRAGAERWPTIRLGFDAFAAHVAAVSAEITPALHGDGLYLAAACHRGDRHAITLFVRHHLGDIHAVIRRMNLGEQAEEITQGLLHALFVADGQRAPFIANYAGRGALQSWLKMVAVREAYRVVRELRRQGRREVLSDALLADRAIDDGDPAVRYAKSRYHEAFKTSFQEAFGELPQRDRQVLRYCYLDGLNLEQVAAIYNISRATAGRWRLDAQQRVLRGVRQRMQAALNMSHNDFESLMNIVKSGLDLSIARLLATRTDDDG